MSRRDKLLARRKAMADDIAPLNDDIARISENLDRIQAELDEAAAHHLAAAEAEVARLRSLALSLIDEWAGNRQPSAWVTAEVERRKGDLNGT